MENGKWLRVEWTGRMKTLMVLLGISVTMASVHLAHELGNPGAEGILDNVVAIEADGKIIGSGVVLSGGKYALTVNHVIDWHIENEQPVMVLYRDGTEVEAVIVKRNVNFDIALLLLPSRHARGLELASETSISVGEKVYAAGHPFGIPWIISQGIVSKKSYFPPNSDGRMFVIWTTAWIESGNSGGPLVTEGGKVIGLVMAYLNPRSPMLGAQHLNICVSSSEIIRFIESE